MPTNKEEYTNELNRLRELQQQWYDQTPADGLWNPADYINNSNFIAGGTFKNQFNKIPEDAQKYIQEQIYKRQQAGWKIDKDFLSVLESHVKANWPGLKNFDISGYLASNKGMAKRINKQDINSTLIKKQTGETPQNAVPKAQGAGTNGTVSQNTKPNAQNTNTQKATQDEFMQQNMYDIEEREKEAAQRVAQQKQTQDELMQQNMYDIEEREKEAQQNQANKSAAVKTQSDQINQDTVDQINDSTDAVGNVSMPKMADGKSDSTDPKANDPDYNPNWTPELEAKYGKQSLGAKQLKLSTRDDEDTFLRMNKGNKWYDKYLKLKKAMSKAKNYQERKNYQDQLDLLLNGVKD